MSLDTRRPKAPSSDAARSRARHRRPTRKTYWARRLLAVVVIFGLWLSWSLGSALLAPGTDSTMAKGAQWARLHYMGWAVTAAEKVQYEFTKPETGGSVSAIPTVAPVAATPSATPSATQASPSLPPQSTAPGNILPIASGTVENEGKWQDIKTLPNGQVAIRGTYLRPDTEHTGYLAGIVWMDPKLARFTLHPGLKVPGDSGWAQPNVIPDAQRGALLGTFNSGFMIVDSHGGFWQQGKQVGDLVQGSASMVFNQDGTMDVRAWEGGAPGAGIESVRQNLVLMVDNGEITPAVTDASVTSQWGATVGNEAFVWRSGVGVRNDGTVVFVGGPALSIQSLAELLKRAGCVRAMELDINKAWVNFMTYHQDNGQTIGTMFTASDEPLPDRYLTPSNRDFVALYTR